MNIQFYFEQNHQVEPSINFHQILTLLQNIAIAHADDMGIGYDHMVKTKTFWVLTRQKIRQLKPLQKGEIVIRTWSRPLHGISATRDFEVYQNGQVCLDCTTRWLVLDAVTRRPTKPIMDVNKLATRTDFNLEIEAEKIESSNQVQTIAEYQVTRNDLDYNNHVNNTRYSLWLMHCTADLFNLDNIKEYDINFISETHLNDIVLLQKTNEDSNYKIVFQGVDKEKKQVLFTAQLALQDSVTLSIT